MAHFLQAFEAIDEEGRGEISIQDLRDYMLRQNYHDDFVRKFLSLFEDDGATDIISLEEFCEKLGLVPRKDLLDAKRKRYIRQGSSERYSLNGQENFSSPSPQHSPRHSFPHSNSLPPELAIHRQSQQQSHHSQLSPESNNSSPGGRVQLRPTGFSYSSSSTDNRRSADEVFLQQQHLQYNVITSEETDSAFAEWPADIKIISSDMGLPAQRWIVHKTQDALVQCGGDQSGRAKVVEHEVAATLKKSLDNDLDRVWQVIVGRGPYSSMVSNEPRAILHFRIGRYAVLAWKTPEFY